jgi:hypothetical protein
MVEAGAETHTPIDDTQPLLVTYYVGFTGTSEQIRIHLSVGPKEAHDDFVLRIVGSHHSPAIRIVVGKGSEPDVLKRIAAVLNAGRIHEKRSSAMLFESQHRGRQQYFPVVGDQLQI